MNAPTTLALRTGGQILIDQLRVHGVDTAFCVPGESYLAALDALYDARDDIRLIVARQDGGAAYMAEAWAKATGRVGICFVTRGPGATNGSVGIHTAHQDSTPMILFVGQVATDQLDREAFQEIDYRRMFGSMTKWAAQIDRADRIPEYVSRAFHLAMSGRPGPVVLALPEDMLTNSAAVADARRFQTIEASPSAADMERLATMLRGAERPLVLVGGTVWNREACADLRRFIESSGIPIACAFRFQDLFDNRHDHYAGDVGIGLNPNLAARIKEADVLLVIGARLGEITTAGYTLLEPPVPKQTLIHVHAGAEELGRVYQGELLINASMKPFARALAQVHLDGARWREWREAANKDYRAYSEPGPNPGKLQMGEIMRWLREHVPEDTIFTSGAGNFTGWVQRFYRFTGWRTQVAPTSGSMGYGVPSAVAAQVGYPDRLVISMNGDGDYMMNGQELATAVQYELPVVFIIVNNGMYGTIRMHQEREYPTRTHGTFLRNPDFAALARAYGAHGECVEETAQFAGAFERSIARGRTTKMPAVIEVRIDPEAITTSTSLSAIREKALKR